MGNSHISYISWQIPRDLETGGRTELSVKLSVTAGPKGNRNAFQKSESVTLEIAKKTIFIQTDKPIYKPGQTSKPYNSYGVHFGPEMTLCAIC